MIQTLDSTNANDSPFLDFNGQFCGHGKLNGPSDIQRHWVRNETPSDMPMPKFEQIYGQPRYQLYDRDVLILGLNMLIIILFQFYGRKSDLYFTKGILLVAAESLEF